MARKNLLDPSIAEVSPNFYNAALQSQLSTSEQQLITQAALNWKTARSLLKLSEEKHVNNF